MYIIHEIGFLTGYKRKVAQLKQDGRMAIGEGKTPLPREGLSTSYFGVNHIL